MQVQERLPSNEVGWWRPDERGLNPQYQQIPIDFTRREGEKVAYEFARAHGTGLDGFRYSCYPQLEPRSMGPNSLYPNLAYTNNGPLANTRLFTRPVTMDNLHGFSDFSVFGANTSNDPGAISVFQPTKDLTAARACCEHATSPQNVDINLTIDITTYPSAPNSKAWADVPCQIIVNICPPQNQANSPTSLIKRDKREEELDSVMQQVETHKHATVPIQRSTPSISPSLLSLSPLHHPLSSVLPNNATLHAFIAQHVQPNDTIRNLAFDMIRSAWLISNEPEPLLSRGDEVVKRGFLVVGKHSSRFEAFFDSDAKHRCRWTEGNERCTHESSRKNRAIGHAHAHFNYKPFACSGKCGILTCRQRFTCVTVLNDHIRKHRRTQACPICKRVVSIKNFRRHKTLHHRDISPC